MMVRTCRGFAWTAAVAAGMVGWMMSASNLRAQEAQEFGLGDIALPEDDYAENQLTSDTLESLAENQWDLTALPEFDARTRGWVTDAKNQGVCGSCWAFAAVGTIESRILKEGGPQFDFSEQQLVSCNSLMYGCCGGSGSSLKFFQNDRPITEASVPYAEAGTNCPTQRTIPCGSISGVDKPYLLSGFYTVQPNPAAFKMSLLTHGPSYFRYDVYSDFFTHWNTAPADAIYQNSGGSREGGHAVLLIGWSDSKQAFLLKNSWGKDGGPNDDGTFWMSYSGHANNLNLQMFNVSDLVHPAVDSRIALVSATAVDAAVQTLDADQGGAGFEESTGYLQSLPIAAEEQAQPADGPDSAPGFGWYNNLRVNGNTTLTDTVGTTKISVYARDVRWRYAFGSGAVTSPGGNGGSGGSGWRFRNAHRFGIVVYQGNRYWNVTSTSRTQPTVITGLTNTLPVVVTVNDTNGNYSDNGGSFDLYVRKDN